jgi:hypothetical protein
MADVFKRPSHRLVLEILRALDADFLAHGEIFFGGGTRVVLELAEYRESRDVDFLCSSQAGYRTLRETVTETSLGQAAAAGLQLAREVRADQYGVRTWVALNDAKIKLEIVREARISLEGERVAGLPVACLTRAHAFAEKFLANADRGLDPSTLSRDAVDLAFMLEGWDGADAARGLEMAKEAYGDDITRKIAAVAHKLRTDRKYRAHCVQNLGVADTGTLSKGLERLSRAA